MPLSSRLVGTSTAAFTNTVDNRWLMAYAAGLFETAAGYFDSTSTLAAHPVFPVCVEWDPILALRFGPGTTSMSAAEQACAVHADHDLHLLAPITPGSRLHTTATAIAVEQRTPGAYLLKRLDTADDAGTLVARTYQGTLYRGVKVTDGDAAIEQAPAWPSATGDAPRQFTAPVASTAAHVYTECARIWNPIHTDRAHALAAGLPDIILHGTATLALAVSRLVDNCLGGDPRRVTRLGGRFTGMVLMPETLTVKVEGEGNGVVAFSVATSTGTDAIRRGFLAFST